MNYVKHISGLLLPPNLPQGPALGWYGPQRGNCSRCGGGEPPDCEYFVDDFDRADSTDLGSDWTETTGDWSIASNKLSISSANARVDCNTTHPDSVNSLVIEVDFSLPANNNQARIWFNGGGHYVDLLKTSGGGQVRIYTAGGTSLGYGLHLGTFNSAKICISPSGLVIASVNGVGVASATVGMSSSQVGLGTGTNSGTITFDNFRINKHGAHTATCPTCPVFCGNCAESPPSTLLLTLSGFVNGDCSECTILNDTFALDWIQSCTWRYCFGTGVNCRDDAPCTAPGTDCSSGGYNYTVRLNAITAQMIGSYLYIRIGSNYAGTSVEAFPMYEFRVALSNPADCNFDNLEVPLYSFADCSNPDRCNPDPDSAYVSAA